MKKINKQTIRLTETDLIRIVGKVISEQKKLNSKKKIMTLPEAWELYLDAHFQHILDNVLNERFDKSNLRKYFEVMSNYMKDTLPDDMEYVYDDYKLGFDLNDIDSSFKLFRNAVQHWEYTRDNEEPSFEEEQDFLQNWGDEMGMFDDEN